MANRRWKGGSSDRFPLLGLQNHCGRWLQAWNHVLLLGRTAMTNLDRVLKSRDSTLRTKVCIVKAMVFAVVLFGCEKWNIKKAECQRIDAFKMWCWGRLLKVSWTTRRSKQSILKEIIPEYSLEVMLKLKLQYFGHLMWTDNSLEKSLMLGKIKGGRGCQRMRWLDGITNAAHQGSLSLTISQSCPSSSSLHQLQRVGHNNNKTCLTHFKNYDLAPNALQVFNKYLLEGKLKILWYATGLVNSFNIYRYRNIFIACSMY